MKSRQLAGSLLLLMGLLTITIFQSPIQAMLDSAAAQPGALRYGTLNVVWGDPGPDEGGEAQTLYFLTADDGETTLLLPDEATTGELLALNGRRVTVTYSAEMTGAQFGAATTLLVSEIVAAGPATIEPAAVSGVERFATVLCKFSNIALQPKSLPYFQDMYASVYPGLDHYWQDTSYGRVSVAGSDAYGYFDLPDPQSAYFTNSKPDLNKLALDCAAAADAAVDFASYNGINFVFNGGLGCCAWGGTKTMALDGPQRTFRVTWLPPWAINDIAVTMHEMGHAFGLSHSSGDYSETYDSPWDVMSKDRYNCSAARDPVYGCVAQGTISYHKDLLGWIPAARRYVHGYGTQSVRLDPLGEAGGDDYLIARVPINGSATNFYTIEARRLAGYDVKLPGAGVVIHEVIVNRERPARVVDPDLDGDPGDAAALWLPGETFEGKDHIRVTVDEQTANGGYWVTISNEVPSDWSTTAVGAGASGHFDDENGKITLSGAGGDIFGAADGFFYAYQTAEDSLEFTTRITAWDAAGGNSAKAGLMMRNALAGDAAHFTVHLTGPNRAIKLKWRDTAGGSSGSADGPATVSLPVWLRIVKTGRAFAAFYSTNGQNWTEIEAPRTVAGFSGPFHYGMAVTSNKASEQATAAFDQLSAAGWSGEAVGQGASGSAGESADGAVAMTAAGGDIFKTADSFYYYYLPGGGDLDLRARLDEWDNNGSNSAKAGLMIRGSAAADAPSFAIHVTGNKRALKLKIRQSAGETTSNVNGPANTTLPLWLRLVKSGNQVSAYYSTDGAYYQPIGSPVNMSSLGDSYLHGLAATSNAGQSGPAAAATFGRVRIGPLPTPIPPSPTPTATNPPPTATHTPTPSNTPQAPVATNTPTPSPTKSAVTATATATRPTATASSTAPPPSATATATHPPGTTPTATPTATATRPTLVNMFHVYFPVVRGN